MSVKIRCMQSGYCPEQDRTYSIAVDFAELHMLGCSDPQYKKLGYLCEYYCDHGCKSCGSNGADCPLFKEAQYL